MNLGDDSMKKCSLCGHIMIDNEKVCSRCGFKITEYSGAEESKLAGYGTQATKQFDLESEKEKIVNRIEQALPNDYRKYGPAVKFFLGLLFAPAFLIFLINGNKTINQYLKYALFAFIIIIYSIVMVAG